MNETLKHKQHSVKWTCRFHPTNWFHEIGCPHKEWTADELLSALITKKEFEQKQFEKSNYITSTK